MPPRSASPRPILAVAGLLLAVACAAGGGSPPVARSPEPSSALSPPLSSGASRSVPSSAVQLILTSVWGGSGSEPGQVLQPGGLSVDFEGVIYVADTGNSRVQCLSPQGEVRRVVGGAGAGQRRFQRPVDVCAAHTFTLLVSDAQDDRMQSFDHQGNFVGFLPGEEGILSHPWGIGVGPDGRVYVADRDDHRVVVFDAQGEMITSLGALGSGPAQFHGPTYLLAGEGRIIVSDTGNDRLQLFDLMGSYLGSWRGSDAPGAGGALREPQGLARGPRGEIYVADAGHARIVVLDRVGRFLTAAGRGAGESAGPLFPTGLALAPGGGTLYVADGQGSQIYVYRVEYTEPASSPR